VSNRLNLAVAVAVFGLVGASSAVYAKDKKADKVEQAPVNPACGSNKISKPMEKPMNAAQKAREQHNWEEMVAQALAADAAQPDKTEFDKFWVHELEGVAYANLKKYPDAIRELDASLNSPCMSDADKPSRTKLLMQLSYQAKDYDKAIDYGKRIYQPGGDPDVGIYLANAYYVKDDYTNARTVMADVVSTMEASGKTPDEQTYRILQSSCLALKDEKCVVDLIEKLVAHYPKPQYWENLIDALLRSSNSDRELLNILRLSDGVGVMKDPGEYIEMAQLATAQGLPGEAQAIVEKGLQKGVFADAKEKEHANRVLGDAKTAVALDKTTLEKQDASARQAYGRCRRQTRSGLPELRAERQGHRGSAARYRQGRREERRRSGHSFGHCQPSLQQQGWSGEGLPVGQQGSDDDPPGEAVAHEHPGRLSRINQGTGTHHS
jgi:tetratricopeptide (TPR) repeat protein